MSIPLWLKKRFGPQVRYEEGSLVRSGSPARYLLHADANFAKSISAIRALVRRHVPLAFAKAEIERLLIGQEVVIELPLLDDAAHFEAEMQEIGIRAIKQVPVAADG